MLGIRPDISVSANYYSRFQENYTESHWRQLKRILKYLKGTIDMVIHFPKNMKPGSLLMRIPTGLAMLTESQQ